MKLFACHVHDFQKCNFKLCTLFCCSLSPTFNCICLFYIHVSSWPQIYDLFCLGKTKQKMKTKKKSEDLDQFMIIKQCHNRTPMQALSYSFTAVEAGWGHLQQNCTGYHDGLLWSKFLHKSCEHYQNTSDKIMYLCDSYKEINRPVIGNILRQLHCIFC